MAPDRELRDDRPRTVLHRARLRALDNRYRRWFNQHRHAIAYVILTIGVIIALTSATVNANRNRETARQAKAAAAQADRAALFAIRAANDACDRSNLNRRDIIASVDQQLQTAYGQYLSVAFNPEATNSERWTTLVAFVHARELAIEVRQRFHPLICPDITVPRLPTQPSVRASTTTFGVFTFPPRESSSSVVSPVVPLRPTPLSTAPPATRPRAMVTTTTVCVKRGHSGKCKRSRSG